MKRLFVAPIVLLVCAFIVIGCNTPTSTPTSTIKPATSPTATTPAGGQQYGGILKIICTSGVTKLGSPAEGTLSVPMYYRTAQPVMEGLMRLDTNESLVPMLAESWDVAKDGKSITFHLRKGVKFQDGTDFNAEAVKYALQNGPPTTALAQLSSIDVIDENTVRLNLAQFEVTFLLQLAQISAGLVPSPTAVQKPTTPENMAKDHMVGTGAYKFVSYKQDDNVKYERSGGYWQKGKPYLDGIQINQIADAVTALISFKKGDAQVMLNIEAKDAKELEALGYEIVTSDMASYPCLYPDSVNSDSPFANVKVRQAIEYAIDKKPLAQAIGKGYYDVVYQFARNQDDRYSPDLVARTYNPSKAKQLLAEAGYPTGFKTSIYASSTTDQNTLVALQTYLKEAGIDAVLDIVTSPKYSTLTHEGWKNGLLFASPPWQGDLSGFIRNFGSLGVSSATAYNRSALRPPGLLEKIDAVITQADAAKRTSQMREIMKLMYDEEMAIPLWASAALSAQEKKVHDLRFTKGHPTSWTPANAWLSK